MAGEGYAYFLSDLHLGAACHGDARAAERRIVAFLDSIREHVSELYLLGDVLDYWYEYRHVVPRGFVRFFGKLAELADSGVRITWIIGNHDIWIFDYLPGELGIEVVDGTVVRRVKGSLVEMSHGDQIGGNLKYRCMRSLFRNRFCQRLYASVHPRWTVAFAKGWSGHSRAHGHDVSAVAPQLLDRLRRYCVRQKEDGSRVDYFMFGHLHLVADEPVSDGARMIVLGDWISHFSYAVFDGRNMRVMEWSHSGKNTGKAY